MIFNAQGEIGSVDYELDAIQSEINLLTSEAETAVADMGSHANRLAVSEISVISTAAGDIIDALPAKVAAEAAATEIDNAMDGEDVRVASELVAPLRQEAIRVNGSWRSDIGPWFKSNKAEAYKEIGNLLHTVNGENVSAVGRVLLGVGVPTTANAMQFHEAYYNSLEEQFKAARD